MKKAGGMGSPAEPWKGSNAIVAMHLHGAGGANSQLAASSHSSTRSMISPIDLGRQLLAQVTPKLLPFLIASWETSDFSSG
jgi:hypothetical protein